MLTSYATAAITVSGARINHFVAVACGFAIVVLAVAVIWRYWKGPDRF
jgi:hypothetical protein